MAPPTNIELISLPGRGRAETIRLLLTFADRKFVDTRMTIAQWRAKRKMEGFNDTTKLPVMKVNETRTIIGVIDICRHVALQYGLYGSSSGDQEKVDDVIKDLEELNTALNPILRATLTKNYDALEKNITCSPPEKPQSGMCAPWITSINESRSKETKTQLKTLIYTENQTRPVPLILASCFSDGEHKECWNVFKQESLFPMMQKYEERLSSSTFLVGTQYSWADIALVEFLTRCQQCYDSFYLAHFENLRKFCQVFESLPTIRPYIQSRTDSFF